MTAIVGEQLGAHGGQATDVELIEQQGFNEIIEMMAQGEFVAIEPVGQ